MAASIKLVYTSDFQADQDSLDLLNFAAGFELAENGWVPKVATGNQDSIIETLTFYVSGLSQDAIASSLHTLEDWIKRVTFSHDSVAPYQVWLRAQDTFESLPRQAMVLEMSGIILDPHPALNFDTRNNNGNYMVTQYVLTIRRTPFWEALLNQGTGVGTPGFKSCIGMNVVSSDPVYGDVPARMMSTYFHGDTGTTFQTFWAGLRTSRFGVLANFQSVWSLNLSSTLGADTSTAADATAYNGNKITCTFSTVTTDAIRSSTLLNDVTVNAIDQRGNFTVLVRAKTNSGSTSVNAYIKYGILTGQIKRTPVTISGTSWKLYELGTVTMPFTNSLITAPIGNMGIFLYLQRLSVAGSIDIDCFVLIPIDEASIKVKASSDITTDSEAAYIYIRADGQIVSFVADFSTLTLRDSTQAVLNNWSTPINNEAPLIVGAAMSSTASVLGDKFQLFSNAMPRYRNLRGNLT